MSVNATTGTQIVTGELHKLRRGHRKGFSPEPPPEPSHRPARVALTLALAHMIQRAIDRGEIRDQAEAARRLGVTRARMTQILDLTLLAPELQERLLPLEIIDGTRLLPERVLRLTTRVSNWDQQRAIFRNRGPMRPDYSGGPALGAIPLG